MCFKFSFVFSLEEDPCHTGVLTPRMSICVPVSYTHLDVYKRQILNLVIESSVK